MHNLVVFLDLWLLLEGQMVVVTRMAFTQLHVVCQLFPFLVQEVLLSVTPGYFLYGLLQYDLHGITLE